VFGRKRGLSPGHLNLISNPPLLPVAYSSVAQDKTTYFGCLKYLSSGFRQNAPWKSWLWSGDLESPFCKHQI
jgi:hypothetical protein